MTQEQVPVTQELRKELIRRIISAYHTTRLHGTPAEDHILSKDSVRVAFDRLASTPAISNEEVRGTIGRCERMAAAYSTSKVYRDKSEWEAFQATAKVLSEAVAALQHLSTENDRKGALLREAREIIAEFGGEFAETFVDDEGWKSPMKSERIVDWFGPSYFHRARNWLKAGEAKS